MRPRSFWRKLRFIQTTLLGPRNFLIFPTVLISSSVSALCVASHTDSEKDEARMRTVVSHTEQSVVGSCAWRISDASCRGACTP